MLILPVVRFNLVDILVFDLEIDCKIFDLDSVVENGCFAIYS